MTARTATKSQISDLQSDGVHGRTGTVGHEVSATSRPGETLEVGPTLSIAYLCAQYPAISHTFVLREILALRRLGVQVATFSIRRTGAEHLLAQADRDAFASTYAILPPRWGKLLAAHAALAARAPRTYLTSLIAATRRARPGLRGRLWQLFYFVEAVVVWNECRRQGVRHIHVHMANVASDVALLTSEIGSAVEPERPWSWSFTLHGPAELFDVGHYGLAEKVHRARFVVCISDFTRSQLMALSDPEAWDRLQVIHVGIPIAQFTRSETSTGPANPARILFIGRLVPEKGHAVLLEALALLGQRGHDVEGVLAGDGSHRATLEQVAQQLGIADRVSFPGAVGQEEIHDLYASASIFCLPSFAEGVPGVLMEAMAMELPVVSTRITGVPELIENERTGLLVSPGRADLLADALERLLLDPQRCRRLGTAARETVVREFNSERSAEQLHELLARELGSPSEMPREVGH